MQSLAKAIPVMVLCSALGYAQVNILTANGSNDRTNSNLQETLLSPGTVSSAAFGQLGAFAVDGQVYSQPLYVSGLSIPGKGTRNVLFVSTMHNTVYAFDGDGLSPGTVLWQDNLGPPVPSAMLYGSPYGDIAGEVGILSTGVIDPQRSVLYVVTDVLQNGAPVFYLHALDLATGAERLNGPIALVGSVAGTGSAGGPDGTIALDPMQHIQRPGLLLSNGAVFVAFGSHGDQNPYHGWMLSYNAADLRYQLGVYMTTPDGNAGALWQSGRGPAADAQGNIYAITGNGDYDGVRNFGESFIKVSAASATLDSFTPSNWKSMSDNDWDISAGPALITGTHTLIGADKGGSLYIIDGDAMRLPGSADIIAASSGSIFAFAVWSRGGNADVYIQGEGEPVKCFQVAGNTINPTPVSSAVNSVSEGRIGMTISANGNQADSGILWETTGDYNAGTPGTLHAYDASNLGHELWNSDMIPTRDQMLPITKFAAPTVVNGRVYVPTNGNAVVVYGLLVPPAQSDSSPSVSAVAHAASYSREAVAPGEVVAIFGANLGPSTPAGLQLDDSGSVAATLADTQVLFDGVPSPLIFASTGQIDAVVPFSVISTTTLVQVRYQSKISVVFPMAVVPAAIGIFSADGSGAGPAIVLNQDGSINSPLLPAEPGSVVTLWATGVGQLSPAGIDGTVVTADLLPKPVLSVSAQVGGQAADVLYAGGAPGMVEGVIQVNLRVPPDSQAGNAVPVALTVGNSTSQPGITLAVR